MALGGRKVTGDYASNGSDFHSRVMQAGLSTQIIIKAYDASGVPYPIGAVQTLTPTETRALTRVSEVGTDGVIQIVPTAATTVDLAVTRMVFDYQRLPAAFQRGFRHIHSARLPFDIDVIDYNPYRELDNVNNIAAQETEPSKFLTTPYYNCWLQNYSYTYDQGNYLISETATIWAEGVYTKGIAGDEDIATGTEEILEAGFSNDKSVSPMSESYISGTDYHSAG